MKIDHPIPNQFIAKTILSREVDDVCYDFEITFTVFGEVLSVENLLQRLPPEAQQMIFGKNAGSIQNRIDYYTGQIRLLVPLLAIGGDLEAYVPGVKEKIETLQSALGYRKLSPKRHIRNIWVKNLWLSRKYIGMEELRWVGQFFSKDYRVRREALRGVKSDNLYLSEPILLNLLKIVIYEEEKKKIYFKISRLRSPLVAWLLGNLLINSRRRNQHQKAIMALAEEKDEYLQNVLLTYLWQNPKVREELFDKVLKTASSDNDAFFFLFYLFLFLCLIIFGFLIDGN